MTLEPLMVSACNVVCGHYINLHSIFWLA